MKEDKTHQSTPREFGHNIELGCNYGSSTSEAPGSVIYKEILKHLGQ